MKRSCDGCRALKGTIQEPRCSLDYMFEQYKKSLPGGSYMWCVRPTEQCPKPITHAGAYNCEKKGGA